MSARDEAVKVGADALALSEGANTVDEADAKFAGAVLDAAHKAGLIVWADDLRAERFRLSEDVIANHEPLRHDEQEIVNEWRAGWEAAQ